MFRVSVLFGWYIILALYGACKSAADQTPVTFSFKEYQYKDSPKNVCISYVIAVIFHRNTDL